MTQITSIISKPETTAKFAVIYQSVHKCSPDEAIAKSEHEKFNFLALTSEMEVTPLSAYKTFLEVISMGLSFNQAQKQVYLIPRYSKGGEKILNYNISADGMIYLAEKAGSIRYCTKPIIIYEGDNFQMSVVDGKTTINHQISLSNDGKKIIGAYCKVALRDGSEDWTVLSIEDIQRLKGYSEKQNKGNANPLYTSNNGQIDKAFLQTKVIKTALKNISKYSSNRTNEYEITDDEAETQQSDTTKVPETIPTEGLMF